MAVILVGGGARSGKSKYALALAEVHGHKLGFVATAQVLDEEMRRRVRRHQMDRGPLFITIEEPYDIAAVIEDRSPKFDALVVDCLTLWLSNLMLSGRDVDAEIDRLVAVAARAPSSVVLVTNEVGCGIVPDNELSRRFRDYAGILNQRVAEVAHRVYFMAFGCPLRVK
ncbi:MAG: bifunctional adenosylcobinamide kinase/adenosylcobinamide-phosphate guanylyltransferase [Bryobacteraceae bacterium]